MTRLSTLKEKFDADLLNNSSSSSKSSPSSRSSFTDGFDVPKGIINHKHESENASFYSNHHERHNSLTGDHKAKKALYFKSSEAPRHDTMDFSYATNMMKISAKLDENRVRTDHEHLGTTSRAY